MTSTLKAGVSAVKGFQRAWISETFAAKRSCVPVPPSQDSKPYRYCDGVGGITLFFFLIPTRFPPAQAEEMAEIDAVRRRDGGW